MQLRKFQRLDVPAPPAVEVLNENVGNLEITGKSLGKNWLYKNSNPKIDRKIGNLEIMKETSSKLSSWKYMEILFSISLGGCYTYLVSRIHSNKSNGLNHFY